MNKLICYMSSLNNLENIILHGGLICKNELSEKNVIFENIANKYVQDKRAQTIVPLAPGGNLHNYVPFYFYGLTPMLFVNRSIQTNIAFFVTYTQTIADANLSYVFTDRHAIVSYVNFYNELHELKNLDWPTIKLRQWANTSEDTTRKEKKQAEFLVYKKLPWELIYGIGVYNNNIKSDIENRLNGQLHKPVIKTKPEWYFV